MANGAVVLRDRAKQHVCMWLGYCRLLAAIASGDGGASPAEFNRGLRDAGHLPVSSRPGKAKRRPCSIALFQ